MNSINEVLVTHKERLSLFFKNLIFFNIDYFEDQHIFNIFLTFAHYFIEDIKNFWDLFNKIYNRDLIFTDYQIKIDFEIFKVIKLLRKFVDHSTSIKINSTNRELITNSNYLKFKGDISNINIKNLYLNQIYIILGKSLEFPASRFIHSNKTTGILYFNDFKYDFIFNTHQIIDDFLKHIDLYFINCIKTREIINKNKTKYLKTSKIITKNSKRNVKIDVKNKIYDFNHKDNPLYDSNFKKSWILTIERKEKQISKQIKLRKEFIITYQYANEKPIISRGYGIRSKHKGCVIGKLMDDLLENDDKITLKNLKKIRKYDIQQPDCLLILLFFILKNVDKKYITKNYLSKEWFLAWGTKTESKDLMELEFPCHLLERVMPFDERISNSQYKNYIILSSYYANK